jgi:hypothetical protein
VIGLLTQEIKFFVSAIRNKVEKSDGQDDNKKEHTKLSKASELMSSVNHKTILRTMKMLEQILLIFSEKHSEEKWLNRKMHIIFKPISNGPSIFASLMQIYLNLAFNMFELSLKAAESQKDLAPQLWLRRGSLEACFRLIEIAKFSEYDPSEILNHSI